jgi:hypothetical protein
LILAPRKRPATNRRRGITNPEIWFRIVHVTLNDVNGSASHREQTVEVTLGPDWAFETGGLGSLTRRVPADQVVTAVPERIRARRPKPAREPQTAPVVETLRKALAWQRDLDAGVVVTQADIARREGVTRARVTQVLMLLRLAPEIQDRILNMPKSVDPPRITERSLRPLSKIGPAEQLKAAKDMPILQFASCKARI